MAIREENFKLADDSRSFTAELLSDVWEWLDSYDMQPLRSRDGARLERAGVIFSQETYTFQGTIYSFARCSDGRAILGSPIGVATDAAPRRSAFARFATA